MENDSPKYHFGQPALAASLPACCRATVEYSLVLEVPDETLVCVFCGDELKFCGGGWQQVGQSVGLNQETAKV